MKKLVFLFIAATLLVALLPAVVSATGDDGDKYCTTLIAGGGNPKSAIDVGQVCVEKVDGYLRIIYLTRPGWCMTETHLHVADSPDGIPQTSKNNPIPGQFDYSTMNQCTRGVKHMVPFVADPTYIAAHAVVCMCDCAKICAYTECDCSETCECSDNCETAWGAGIRFNDKNWATYFMYPAE